MKNKKIKILYVGNFCSEKEYKKIFKNCDKFICQQSQKFNRLLTEGFSQNLCDIEVLSGRPVGQIQRKKIFKGFCEVENGVKYNYLPFLNFKFIRNFALYHNAKSFAKKWCKNNPDGVMICDVLNASVVAGSMSVFKKNHQQIVGIITDLPVDLKTKTNFLFINKLNSIIKKCDKYVLLASAMKDELNISKPFCVIEGICETKQIILDNKTKENVLLYTGTIHKKYGIKLLVDAFLKLNKKDWILKICGVGDYEEELKEISKNNKNIEYLGSVSNTEACLLQKQAKLLINPRPTNEHFVKFSFPSKNIEYMASGTATITTKIPSMPKEYYDYVYLLEDETINGFCLELDRIMSLPCEELTKKGEKAKKFVLMNKNNKKQTQKIINLIEEKRK